VVPVLGVSEVACRVITHRALKKLKKELDSLNE
jgi:DNA-directed RNA polymerase specialized sigma24 family protein